MLTNQKCEIIPTLIDLHPHECRQEFHYYPFVVELDRRAGNYNALNDLYNKVCVSKKTYHLNLSVLSMITGINKSKALTKHILCACECKFDEK